MQKLLEKVIRTHRLTEKELISLLKVEGEDFNLLLQKADQVRTEYVGDEIHLRGIIEFSSYCKRNCHYCGLRRDNKSLQRYRLTPEEMIELGLRMAQLGYRTVVLQSGEDSYDAHKLARVIRELKERAGVAVTLSLGEREYEEYKLWREAGADRYLLKHEIADEEIYNSLHPGMSYRERIQCLRQLKELGYQTGSGNIIGLPGQTLAMIARDLLLFKELNLPMMGIGPFVPHPETPLAGAETGKVELTLKTIALARLLLPASHIPATTALNTISPAGRTRALQGGANVIMPNVTPYKYRSLYDIYPKEDSEEDRFAAELEEIKQLISDIGRRVGRGYGHGPTGD